MHHNIILRLAIGLTGLLLVVSLGFALAVSGSARRFAARGAQDAMYSESAAAAAYGKRCGTCHTLQQTENWVARQPARAREAEVFRFLQQHGKAREAENRLIARFLTNRASVS